MPVHYLTMLLLTPAAILSVLPYLPLWGIDRLFNRTLGLRTFAPFALSYASMLSLWYWNPGGFIEWLG